MWLFEAHACVLIVCDVDIRCVHFRIRYSGVRS